MHYNPQNLNHQLPGGAGWVGGRWQNMSQTDFKPTISFEIIADDYIQIKFRNLRDN